MFQSFLFKKKEKRKCLNNFKTNQARIGYHNTQRFIIRARGRFLKRQEISPEYNLMVMNSSIRFQKGYGRRSFQKIIFLLEYIVKEY